MNPFIQPADLRAVHKRLGHLLPGAVHQLLRANEPVEGIEPLPPKPRKERKVRADPNATGKTVRAKVLSALTDLSLIHISEPTRPCGTSRMPSSA